MRFGLVQCAPTSHVVRCKDPMTIEKLQLTIYPPHTHTHSTFILYFHIHSDTNRKYLEWRPNSDRNPLNRFILMRAPKIIRIHMDSFTHSHALVFAFVSAHIMASLCASMQMKWNILRICKVCIVIVQSRKLKSQSQWIPKFTLNFIEINCELLPHM